MIVGGLDVMMVALRLSPVRKSDMPAGLPLRMIFTPRLSMSPCVNDLIPSGVLTMMDVPLVAWTVPFFTSVTVTGVTVVFVVMVAVPFMPTVNSRTDIGFPLIMKRKSSATFSSLVPSGRLTTNVLPSTAITSNALVSVAVVVVCACDPTAVRHTTAAAKTTRLVALVITFSI